MLCITAIRVAAVGVALVAFAVPTTVRAQRSPIAISACTVVQAPNNPRPEGFWYPTGPHLGRDQPYVDGLQISYTNMSSRVADRVAFTVIYRGDQQRIVDVGTFSPKAPITHVFGTFSGDAYLGARPNECRAIAVRFADGTVWRAAGVVRGAR